MSTIYGTVSLAGAEWVTLTDTLTHTGQHRIRIRKRSAPNLAVNHANLTWGQLWVAHCQCLHFTGTSRTWAGAVALACEHMGRRP